MWKTQLRDLGLVLANQEKIHESIKAIDAAILHEEPFPLVFDASLSKLAQVMQSESGYIDAGDRHYFSLDGDGAYFTSAPHSEEKSFYRVYEDPNQRGNVIRGLGFRYNNDAAETATVQHLIKEAEANYITPLMQQWNVCLNKTIQDALFTLFKEATSKMSSAFNPDAALSHLAGRMLRIFPPHHITRFGGMVDSVRVQILMIERSGDGGRRLRIIQSSDPDDAGDLVRFDGSVCGTLLREGGQASAGKGFKQTQKGNRLIPYFLGDPTQDISKGLYAKTSMTDMRSELAIPLYSLAGDPVGALNLESEEKDVFKRAHSQILANLSDQIGPMIQDLHSMSMTWTQNNRSVYQFLGETVNRAVKNFYHQSGNTWRTHFTRFYTKMKRGRLTEEDLTAENISEMLEAIQTGLDGSLEALRDSLTLWGNNAEYIDFKEKTENVRQYLSNDLKGIEFIDTTHDVPPLRLNPVFIHHYCELVMNAIKSIRAKEASLKDSDGYEPRIVISGRPVEFVIRDEDEQSPISASRARKYEISVYDNGQGVSEEQQRQLGDLGVSFSARGTGYGLYTFIQYLAVIRGKHFIESKEGEYFRLKFVVDTLNSREAE